MWKVAFLVLAAVSTVSSSMPGGLQDANLNDDGVKDALNFAVVQHNRVSNDLYLRQVAQVVKVQTQVVAGIKYVITANMARTLCSKRKAQELCEVPEQAQHYQCTFTVWSRPWLNQVQLLSDTCNPSNNI